MHKIKFLPLSIILVLSLLLAGPSFDVSARPLAANSPPLGKAESFSVLGATTVTNHGTTTMAGDLGVWPGSAVTGILDSSVGGHIHKADGVAKQAQKDTSTAFDFLDQPCDTTYPVVQDLSLVSPLVPGVYCAPAFLLTKNLALSPGVYIFISRSTLTTSPGSSVTGGDPCNIWWRLESSGTLDTTTNFMGSILAYATITLNTGASLNGRALAETGAVNLHSNVITGEICLAAPAPVPTAKPTAKPTIKETSSSPHETAVAATAAALAGVVPGLPGTGGGAPIRNEDLPWSLVIVGGFSALALVFGVRAFRRTYRPKQ